MLTMLGKQGVIIFSLVCLSYFALAQGSLTPMNTGGGSPVVSEVRLLFIDGALDQPRLLFNMGFATDESVASGLFLDSFTVTIQDSAQNFTAVYFTADASGLILAPVTPGTIFMDPATVQTSAATYPSLTPVLFTSRAYAVSAPIPPQFLGRQISVYFDLFDNQNSIASQAWFSNPSVSSVPEPSALVLLLVAGAGMWRFKRF